MKKLSFYCPGFRSLLSLLLVLAFVCGCGKKEKPSPPPPGVTVVPVIEEDVVSSHSFVGQGIAYNSVNLIARVEGFLEKRNFEEGQKVKKGRLLFEIEKDQYKASVKAAKANLAMAKATLEKALLDYDRKKTLLEKNAVSRQEFDKAKCEKSSTEAKVLEAASKLQQAKLNLSYTEIKAPFDGRVGFANYDTGNLVTPSSEPLANIVQVDPMKVQFTISEKQMTEGIRAGLRAKGKKQQQFIVKVVLPDGTLYSKHGVIKFIDNRVNPLTGTIKLRAVFPNPDDLLIPGQYLKVSVEREKTHKALLVPRAAIQQDQSGKYVMLVDKDNKVAIRHIKTKGDFGINTVVEEGLKKGEKVITLGLQKVRPGIRVAPVIDKPYKGAAAPAEKSGKKDGSRKERK